MDSTTLYPVYEEIKGLVFGIYTDTISKEEILQRLCDAESSPQLSTIIGKFIDLTDDRAVRAFNSKSSYWIDTIRLSDKYRIYYRF